jgi:nucleotidyltransferase/DNA polymerase involved in DNA repair
MVSVIEILYGFADELEPVSVDEALIDVTSSTTAEDNSESELASQIRSSIREKTGCEASIGCGSNILLARSVFLNSYRMLNSIYTIIVNQARHQKGKTMRAVFYRKW